MLSITHGHSGGGEGWIGIIKQFVLMGYPDTLQSKQHGGRANKVNNPSEALQMIDVYCCLHVWYKISFTGTDQEFFAFDTHGLSMANQC